MQIRSRPLALAAALALGGAAAAAPLASGGDRHAKAQLRDQQGNVVGVVHLNEHGGEVVVRAEASGITAGFHGFHIHQRGECTGTFTGAGPDNLAHVPARYHQHPDDIFGADAATRATGDAGARIACGTVRFDAQG